MLSYVRKGDSVIVESISRFARNTKDLLELVETLNSKEVIFISIADSASNLFKIQLLQIYPPFWIILTLTITLDLYTHVTEDLKRDAISQLEDLLQ